MATIYTDIDLTFTMHPGTGDITKKIDAEAVKGSLKNILMTDMGQRPFDQYYGLGLKSLLFELAGAGQKIVLERLIREKLAAYEPRVFVEKVVITEEYEAGELSVELYYYVVGIESEQSLNISVERVR